jgi:site-specific recombinase XerD
MNNPKIHHPSITKFQQFVELKDYRPPTKKEYVRYVRKCAEHFQCDPLTLSEDELRAYFLFLRQEKHYSRSAMKAAKFSLRSFFVDCHRVSGWTVFSEVRIAKPTLLPVVLSRQEVAAVLGVVRQARMGVCLELIYHCGLRVGEAVAVQVRDVHESRTPIHACTYARARAATTASCR